MNRRILTSAQRYASTLRAAAAPIAMLALWSLMSAAAEASCGDYVTLGHGAAHGMHAESDHSGRPAIPSCNGPQCHRDVPSPLPPDSLARGAVIDAWNSSYLLVSEILPRAAAPEDATLRFASALAPRIDRPPKAAL
jgi:hypothetical protein